MSPGTTVLTSSMVDRLDRDFGERRRARDGVRVHVAVLVAAVASCSLIEDLDRYDRGDPAAAATATSTGAASGSGGADGGCGDDGCEPCVGFGVPEVIADDTARHYGLVVDGSRAYWLTDGPPGTRLMSVDKEGGVATSVVATDAGVPMLPSLTSDSTALYWSMFGKKQDLPAGLLSRIDKQSDAGAVLTYLAYHPIGALVADGNNIYWPHSGGGMLEGIHKSPKDGNGDIFLVAAAAPRALALDATNVYYGAAEGDSYFIRRIDKGGASDAGGTDLATGTGRCMGLAVDATHVYWTVDAGTICSIPLSGGACEALATGQDSPESILLDDHAIYWTTSTSVMCLPRSGGSAQAIAVDQGEPRFLVSDGSSLYWMSEGVGVMGMRR